MKLSAKDQESIVSLLTRIYMDILAIEEEYQMLVGDGDFRPRIEYFHDAVRAFTSGEEDSKGGSGRLAVELLAYDLSCLRYIQEMPLSPFKPHGGIMSPRTDIMTAGPGVSVPPKRPGRDTRQRLTELYEHYAVLFAALLKPFADKDFNARLEDMNQDVQDLSALAQQMEALADGKGSIEAITAAIQHLEDEGLRQALLAFLQQQKHKDKGNLKKLVAFLKQQVKSKDGQIASIESAHMNYALNQLGIFENSKDMLKKMAMQGTNLVGKFVEASLAETRREIGR